MRSHVEAEYHISNRSRRNGKKRGYFDIGVPATLDLASNYEETVMLIRTMRRHALRYKHPIRLTFEDTKEIKPAALLLLLAELHRCRLTHGNDRITGTYPNNPRVERIMETSGFFNLLGVAPRSSKKKRNYPLEYIEFISGKRLEAETVKELRDALLGSSIAMTLPAKRRLYRALTEAMINVGQHAYPVTYSHESMQRGRWWLAGHVNKKTGELMVTFCDLGVGIPSTLPKLYPMEYIRSALSLLPGIKPNDAEMIQAGMTIGRSITKQYNRGKGLNDLRQFVDQAGTGELHIYSGKGHYCYSPNGRQTENVRNYDHSIGGTLIQWSVPLNAVTNWSGNIEDDTDEDNIDS